MKLINGMLSDFAAKKRSVQGGMVGAAAGKGKVMPTRSARDGRGRGRQGGAQPGRGREPDASTQIAVQKGLHDLFIGAKLERLECALPLVESIQILLDDENAGRNGQPAGTLTVKGWMGLLNRWEMQVKSIRPRQLAFTQAYFQESLEKQIASSSPLQPMIRALVDLIESSYNATTGDGASVQ